VNPINGNRNNRFKPDSTLTDSSRNFTKVPRSIRKYTSDNFNSRSQQNGDSLYRIPAIIQLWDESDTLSGWVQTLGNTGKPVLQRYDGLPNVWLFPHQGFIDPLSGERDAYLLSIPSEQKFYNTHTPYVMVNFAQASKRLQLLNLEISQNISPYWNTTIGYKRRVSEGNFLNSAFDHYQVYITQFIRSRNRRYHLMASGTFQKLVDGINGGVDPDIAISVSELNPLSTSVEIKNGRLERYQTEAWFKQSYRLNRDSNAHHQWSLVQEGNKSYYLRKYLDSLYTKEAYPPFKKDSSFMRDFRTVRSLGVSIGLKHETRSLSQEIKTRLQYQEYGLSYTRLHQTTNEIYYLGTWNPNSVLAEKVSLQLSYRQSVFLPPARWGNFNWQTPLGKFTFPIPKDSSKSYYYIHPVTLDSLKAWRPWQVKLQVTYGEINPNLMDTLYQSNTLTGVGLSHNQIVLHISPSIAWQAPDRIKSGKYRYKGNACKLRGFYSKVNAPVLYDTLLGVIPRGISSNIQWAGVELNARLRINRFYLEPNITVQKGSSNSSAGEYYVNAQPNAFGKVLGYYENELFKKAAIVSIGLQATLFTNYTGFRLDPLSGAWYPGNYAIPAFTRVDAFANARIKDAVIFVRLLNLGHTFYIPQYDTTPFYPMWGRVFSFGVNWTFFD